MKIKANAKINLTLDVVGKKADGYHLIDSVFQSVSLYDEVTVEKSEDINIICTDSTIDEKLNIAYIAAQSFFEYLGIKGGAKITLKKNIPLASGMGGGSADAAAVIVALDKLYDTQLDTDTLCKIGLSVGADVPFCIVGGTMRVGGVGEILQKLPNMPKCSMLVIKHGKKQSTGEMYKKIDACKNNVCTTPNMVAAINNNDLSGVCSSVSNAFSAVCNNAQIIEDIKTTDPLAVSLSGSGPTVFAIYNNDYNAQSALNTLKGNGYNPIALYPVDSGLIIE